MSIVSSCTLVVTLMLAHGEGEPAEFQVEMDGTKAIPPAPTTATGTCTGELSLDQDLFSLSCGYDGLVDVTDVHVHDSTDDSTIFSFSTFDDTTATQTFAVTAAQAAKLLAGEYYMNIHSELFPIEEIRGTIYHVDDGVIIVDGQALEDDGEFQGLCGAALSSNLMLTYVGLLCLRSRRRRC